MTSQRSEVDSQDRNEPCPLSPPGRDRNPAPTECRWRWCCSAWSLQRAPGPQHTGGRGRGRGGSTSARRREGAWRWGMGVWAKDPFILSLGANRVPQAGLFCTERLGGVEPGLS